MATQIAEDLMLYLRPGQIARDLGVSNQRVDQWMRAGLLPYRMSPLGRLIHPGDFEEFRRRRETQREVDAKHPR